MRIVAFGDSITFGQWVNPEQRWTTRLAERTGHEVVNRGVCADTTRLGLERWPRDVWALNPDAVIIQFGLNDCNRWDDHHGLPRVSSQAFAANLHEMVDRARANDNPRVYIAGVTQTRKPIRVENDAAAYDRIAATVAWERGCTFIPVRHHGYCLRGDGVHLTPGGHADYACTVRLYL